MAVWAHRSAPVAAAVLGALKAGAAFTMLDPAYPPARLVEILRIAAPRALVRLEAGGPLPDAVDAWLIEAGCARVDLPRGGAAPVLARLAGFPDEPPAVATGPDDVAVLGFTSGSTGTPKGIAGRHGPLTHFLPWQCERFGLDGGDRFSLLSGLAHDPLQRDIFTPLYLGATIVVPDPEDVGVSGRLAAWMAREGVTVAHLTPAMGQILTERPTGGAFVEVPGLRLVLLVGDALTRLDVARIRRLAPRVTCVNLYGSTETQRAVAYHVCAESGEDARQVLPLGAGMRDVQLLVINRAGRLAGIGEVGEIAVRSPHLAGGYLGDAALTADKFRVNPFTGLDGDRIYRTGDLGRYLPDGEVAFAGRADQQVKIRGFRIEPAEIEARLAALPGVREAVVVAREDRGEKRLVAYIVPERAEGAAVSPAFLRQALRDRLPAYMVPSAFVLLERLPITPNGKVDRRALPAPPEEGGAAAGQAAPESAVEERIAAVWREVLGVERVGVTDNFFDVGGHSLLLVRLHSRLQEVLGREISLMELFSHPSIRSQADHLGGGRAPARPARRPAPEEPEEPAEPAGSPASGIAIVGMAGRFPRARDLEAFWRNLRDGVDAISFFSDAELAAQGFTPEILAHPKLARGRGVLEDEAMFDADFFDVAPRQAELMDPQIRHFLECSWEALENAGYDPSRFPGQIGVYGGVTISSYLLYNLLSNPRLIQEAGSYQVAIATDRDFLTTQVSYKLNLRGPSLTVQTACSTSLVATHLACLALLAGECDMALAGGVSIKTPQVNAYVYEEGGLDSFEGHCRSFDAKADGSVYGGGVGIVVLKRLEDALADGDTVHAVILGSAINNDGSAKVGYTAPSIEGQSRAIAEAQSAAGVAPETIGYVECHGSGTMLGDPIEVAALTRAFASSERGFCPIGSVKSSIGHLGAAAGVAGLIKAVLALEHREIPPSLHFEAPNPQIDFASSPFYVNSRLSGWPADRGPRRAGVSSFGLGGTNAHAVLEEAPPLAPTDPGAPWQLLVLSARTETALEAATDRLAGWLERHPEADLADVAHTLQVGRRELAWRRTLVCRDAGEARTALAERDPRALRTAWTESGGRSPVAFLLPGVGDHYPGMARGLYDGEPVFRRELDRCLDLLRERSGEDLREVIFAEDRAGDRAADGGLDLRRMLGRGGEQSEASRKLSRTVFAQPAVFAIEYALARLLESWGVTPDALLGYSLGEYTAACLAGVFSLEDALTLVAERARWIEELPAGEMLAVALPEVEVRSRLDGELSVAATNGPQLTVVSGPPAAIASLAERLTAEGAVHRRLPTTHAFHSPMMEPLAERLTGLARTMRLSPPRIPCLSNVTGTWLRPEEATDPGYWARHLCGTVRFAEALEELWRQPSRVLLEVGPGQGLSALALQHPAARGERVAVPALPHAEERRPDAAFVAEALGRLWLAGVEIDWSGVHAGARRRRLPLPTYPFERRRFWVERKLPWLAAAGPDDRLPETWLSVPSWRRAPLPAGRPAGGPRGPWLLALTEGPASRLGRRLAERLAADGHPPERVLSLAALAEGRDWDVGAGAEIVAVTDGLHELSGGDLLPEHAALLAVCRRTARERGVECRGIDLPPVLEETDRWVDLLAAEIAHGGDESVAYAPRGQRWLRTRDRARAGGAGLALSAGGFCLLLTDGDEDALAGAAERWLTDAGVAARRAGEPAEVPADAPAPLGVIVVAGGERRLLAARELARRGAGFVLVLAATSGGEAEAARAGLFAQREALESGLPWRTVTFEGAVPPAPLAAEALRLAVALGDPEVFVTPPATDPPGTGAPPPSPSPRPRHLQRPHVAPRDETERKIAGLMEGLLGLADLSAHDSFFEQGGHSLLGTRLLSRLRDELGVELAVATLFEHPTPASLAEVIAGLRPASVTAALARAPRGGEIPLSFAQERIWFLDQLQPGSAAYNIPAALRLTGPLDGAALAGALSAMVARHESLRTTFAAADGPPAQRIAPAAPHPLPRVDLTALPGAAREAEALRLAREEARRPFDLVRGPLLRTALIDLGGEDRLLLVNMHHIISDGWSLGVFVREMGALYQALAAGRPSPLPELPIQYADFAVWQRRWLAGEVLERHLAHWRERLGGELPVLELPVDRPRGAVESFAGARWPVRLAPELARRLGALGRERSATLFMVVLAAFDALLHRYTGQEDLTVGTPIAGRSRPELEGLIGMFINTLVLRADLAGEPAFGELLGRDARDRPRRLRPPGPAVREAGRGAAAGAEPRPLAAVPGAVHPAEHPLGGGRDRRRSRDPAAGRRLPRRLALRPHPVADRDPRRVGRLPGAQDRTSSTPPPPSAGWGTCATCSPPPPRSRTGGSPISPSWGTPSCGRS